MKQTEWTIERAGKISELAGVLASNASLLEQSLDWDERLNRLEDMIGEAKEFCERLGDDLLGQEHQGHAELLRTLNNTRASLYLLQRGIGNAPSPFIQ